MLLGEVLFYAFWGHAAYKALFLHFAGISFAPYFPRRADGGLFLVLCYGTEGVIFQIGVSGYDFLHIAHQGRHIFFRVKARKLF